MSTHEERWTTFAEVVAKNNRCAACGRRYGERRKHILKIEWPDGEPEPPYQGREIIVSRSEYLGAPTNRVFLVLWDGTWRSSYSPFCSLKCALAYARAAHAKMYNRSRARAQAKKLDTAQT